MERYTIKQRVKVIETYYQNGRSVRTAYRALRDFFGQHNRPSESTISRMVQKFEETGSVQNVTTPVRPRSVENIAAVEQSVDKFEADGGSTATNGGSGKKRSKSVQKAAKKSKKADSDDEEDNESD